MTDPTTWPLDKLIRLIDAADSLLREGSTGPACKTLGELQERRNAMSREFRARCECGEVPKHLSYCEPPTTQGEDRMPTFTVHHANMHDDFASAVACADWLRANWAGDSVTELYDRISALPIAGTLDVETIYGPATVLRTDVRKPAMTDAYTLRMLGDNVTFNRSQWLDLLDELRPDSDLARRISELLDGPRDV